MSKNYHGTYAYKTDRGRLREKNEDQAMVLMNSIGETLLIACDGVGGADRGELASKIAIDIIADSFKKKSKHFFAYGNRLWITKAVKEANEKINRQAERNAAYKGMGTTMVCALISKGRLMVANIGDSRAYLLTPGTKKIEQLTEDQTYVQYLVTTGRISKEDAASHPDRHVLMNALGIYPSVSLSIIDRPYRGETLLLSTDGLYNQVPAEQIANILSTDDRPDQKVAALVSEANHAGGTDNVGIALWECISHD